MIVTTRELRHRRQLFQSVKTVMERVQHRIKVLESKATPTDAEHAEYIARQAELLSAATEHEKAKQNLRDGMRDWANSTDSADLEEEARLEAARSAKP